MSISSTSNVWHPFTQMKTAKPPLKVVKAEGTWLYTEDGRKYLDVNSSWWVNVHGHGNSYIKEAISAQFEKIDHVIFAGATHPKGEELAKRICEVLPNHFEKVFFSDDGSTSVEVALKMAFQYFHNQGENKRRVLALDGSYHGDTFGAMSIGQRGYFNEPFEHFFFDVDFLDFPEKEAENEILQHAKKLFQTEEFAALIVEPLVQGSAGMRMYSAGFLDQLTRLARENNVLVIFDEIMTGWGRTGKLFAMNHCQELPDIVCLSKGLTGGVLPLGLTVTTNAVYEAFLSEEKVKALLHGHSFTGNPLSCAAACASLDLFAQDSTKKAIEELVGWNTDLKTKIESGDWPCSVRQTGTILAIEIETGEGNTYFSSIRDEAYEYFQENEILLRPLGNVIFINPPYSITKAEHEHFEKALFVFLNRIKAQD